MKQENDLTTGPIGKKLFSLTIPMIFGILSIMVFNLVDTFFVSLLGTRELAAISFTFPVVLFIGSIAMGLGTAASSVVSQAIGEGDTKGVKRLTTDSLVLAVLIVVLFVFIGFKTMRPTFTLLGADNSIFPLIHQYMRIWYVGIVFLVVPMVGNHAIRASGDTKLPGLIMVFSALVNILLDPLLIFGLGPFPRLGLAGAAIATVIARSFALIFSLTVLCFQKKMLDFSLQKLSIIFNSWKKILYIGIPSAASNILLPLSTAVIMSLVAKFGIAAVAAVGVGLRIEAFALVVIIALSAVLVPFVGQNWGAKKMKRIYAAQKLSNRFSFFWGLGCTAILFLMARPLGRLFSNDLEVINNVAIYLWILPICYGLRGIRVFAISVFNAINKPLISVSINFAWMFGLYVPLSYIGAKVFKLKGIFFAIAFSHIIAGIVSLFLVENVCKKKLEQ
tara:strand:+ start:475 stop:1818 length:1344 start_codon:yes stop_codon:yes gene_type:complete